MMLCKTSIICVVALVVSASILDAQETLAIRAGTIVTAVSEPIKNGVILVRNGRVLEVGSEVQIPADARVLRYPSGVILPGLIECHSSAGLRVANENVGVVPYLTVLDGINPKSDRFQDCLRDGVTTVHVIPGNATQIGGQGAVLRPVGPIVDAMILKSPSAMKISVSPRGGNRMDHMSSLRRTFQNLYAHLEALAATKVESPELPLSTPGDKTLSELLRPTLDWKKIDFDKIPEEKIETRRLPLVDLVRGKLPAFIYCERASDIRHAFEVMDAYQIRATLVLGPDAHRARDLLAGRENLGLVVLDATLEYYDRDLETGKDRRYLTARLLYEAGVKFAVQSQVGRRRSGVFPRNGAAHLWYQAATLVKQGLPRAEAVRTVTVNPARILGLDHRIGSIEKGKDANLAIFTGDAFDVRSWVDRVFVEGEEVYNRASDRDLKELLRRKEKDF